MPLKKFKLIEKRCLNCKKLLKLKNNRDNYTCQECGKRKVILHVHHLKSFSQIIDNFMIENKKFKNNKSFLLKLAKKNHQFWDMNNGVTLCKPCHRKKHPKIYLI